MDIAEHCLNCGVCCFAKSGTYVRVSESDWERLGDDVDHWARRVGKQAYMRMSDGHCLALQITNHRGQLPEFFCAIYEKRPQVCRDLKQGGAACKLELSTKGARVVEEYSLLGKRG